MHNTSSQDSQDNPKDTQQDPADEAKGSLLVDEFGKPYGERNNSQKPKEHRAKLIRALRTSKNLNVWLTAIIAISTVFQTVNSCNNNAATSEQVKNLITAADGVNIAATKFSTSAEGINTGVGHAVEKLEEQARATQDATRSSQDALHISERAYITSADMTIDESALEATIRFKNDGRIPSGTVNIVAHMMIVGFPDKSAKGGNIIFRRWQEFRFPPMHNTISSFITLPLKEITVDDLKKGRRAIFLAGEIDYGDGFPHTPTVRKSFCSRTIFQATRETYIVIPCDPDYVLPKLTQADEYPSDTYKEQSPK